MRRKIHGVFGIIEGVNVQIDFYPIAFVTLTHPPALAHAPARLPAVVSTANVGA
jgi:hypothetical protein